MKIFLDNIIYELQIAGGVSTYWSELKRGLSREGFEYIQVSGFGRKWEDSHRKDNSSTLIHYLKLFYRYLPLFSKNSTKFIFHSSYYRYSTSKNALNITTVHDFIYEKYRVGLPRAIHSWQKFKAIRNSAGIICVSENTKRDLLQFCPSVHENQIKVIHNGVSEDFYPLKDISLVNLKRLNLRRDKLILYIGGRDVYKNFNLVIQVLRELKEYKLVIVGGGPLSTKDLLELDTLGKNRYQYFSWLSNDDLNIIYNLSSCLLYPSLYEGFGIPVLEAMRSGCPVIACNSSSIPEVAGDAALLFNNDDPLKVLDCIRQLEIPGNRENIVSKGFEQVKKFSWSKCVNETISFYKEICNSRSI